MAAMTADDIIKYNKQAADYTNYVAGGNQTSRDAANVLLGGPVGWYESATGKYDEYNNQVNAGLGGENYNKNMTQEIYASMSPAERAQFNKMSTDQQNQWLDQRQKDLASGKAAAGQQDAEAQRQAGIQSQQQDIINKVKAFADEMGMPVSELLKKDEFAKQLNNSSFSNAMTQGSNRGFGLGGISVQNANDSQARALLGYQGQRQAAGQNALQSAYGMINTLGQNQTAISQYNQGLDLQLQQAKAAQQQQAYQQGLSQNQNMFGMAGGIIGGIYGGPAGAAAGQKIGAGVGGATYGTYTPYQYKYPSSQTGGGLGGQNYGGNY